MIIIVSELCFIAVKNILHSIHLYLKSWKEKSRFMIFRINFQGGASRFSRKTPRPERFHSASRRRAESTMTHRLLAALAFFLTPRPPRPSHFPSFLLVTCDHDAKSITRVQPSCRRREIVLPPRYVSITESQINPHWAFSRRSSRTRSGKRFLRAAFDVTRWSLVGRKIRYRVVSRCAQWHVDISSELNVRNYMNFRQRKNWSKIITQELK